MITSAAALSGEAEVSGVSGVGLEVNVNSGVKAGVSVNSGAVGVWVRENIGEGDEVVIRSAT